MKQIKELIVLTLEVVFFIPMALTYRVILDKEIPSTKASEHPDNAYI